MTISPICYVSAIGATSVMVARGALWNASIFSPKGKLPWEDIKREYIRQVVKNSNQIIQLFSKDYLL